MNAIDRDIYVTYQRKKRNRPRDSKTRIYEYVLEIPLNRWAKYRDSI